MKRGKGKKGKRKKKGSKKIYKKMQPFIIGLGGLKLVLYHLFLKKMALTTALSFILSKVSFVLATLVALKQFFHAPVHHRSSDSSKLEVVHIPIKKYHGHHSDKDYDESQFIPVTFSPDTEFNTTPFYYDFPYSEHNPGTFFSSDEELKGTFDGKFNEDFGQFSSTNFDGKFDDSKFKQNFDDEKFKQNFDGKFAGNFDTKFSENFDEKFGENHDAKFSNNFDGKFGQIHGEVFDEKLTPLDGKFGDSFTLDYPPTLDGKFSDSGGNLKFSGSFDDKFNSNFNTKFNEDFGGKFNENFDAQFNNNNFKLPQLSGKTKPIFGEKINQSIDGKRTKNLNGKFNDSFKPKSNKNLNENESFSDIYNEHFQSKLSAAADKSDGNDDEKSFYKNHVHSPFV